MGDKNWENQIKTLVEASQIGKARQILSTIFQTPGEKSAALKYWRHVLEEPKVVATRLGSGDPVRKNIEWLQEHAKEYKGKWVALKTWMLLGSHENQVSLYRIMEKSGALNHAVFMKIGE